MADINIGPTKAEDSPHVSGDQGVMALGVRNDAGAPLAADGDYIPLTTDSTGALRTTGTGAASVAVTSVVPGTGATNLGKAEDSPHTSADVGIMPLAVRNDAGAALAADGDYIPLSTDSTGALRTTSTGGASGTEYDEDTPHVSGDKVTMAGVVQQTADAALSSDGDRSLLQVDDSGFLKVNVKAGGGSSVAVTSVVPGTGATNLGKAEDGPHTSGDVGVMALAVRSDAGAAFAADGDYVSLSVDANGALRTSGAGATTQYAEDSAHVSGDQVTMAGVVQQAADAALSSDGDRSVLQVDATGFAKVNVKASALPTGAATLAEQQTQTASLSVIDDWDETDRAKVNPIVGQAGVAGGNGTVGATTQRVVLATDGVVPLPTGAATAANQATEIASLSILDDWDETDRAKVNPIAGQAGVQGGAGATTALTQRVVMANDVTLLVQDVVLSSVFVTKTVDWSAAATGTTIWDPAASNRFVITDIVVSVSGACVITVFDETDTTALRVFKASLAANGGAVINYRKPYVSAAVNNILKITITGAGAVGFITVNGYETT